jgi:hypothetical protein
MQDSDLEIPTEMPSLKDMIAPRVNIVPRNINTLCCLFIAACLLRLNLY